MPAIPLATGPARRRRRRQPTGTLSLITDTLSSHKSPPIAAWLAEYPRVQQVFLPVAACWLNLQEGWWRLFRREALAGLSFADGEEIEQITALATTKLNARNSSLGLGPPRRNPRDIDGAVLSTSFEERTTSTTVVDHVIA